MKPLRTILCPATTTALAACGPGEVRAPMQLARRPGGGFALYDVGQAAILLYGPDLEHERTVTGIGTISYAKDLLVLDDGSFVLAGGALRPLADGGFLFSFGAPLRVVRFPAGAGLQTPETMFEDLELRPDPADQELLRLGARPKSVAFQWWLDRSSAAPTTSTIWRTTEPSWRTIAKQRPTRRSRWC